MPSCATRASLPPIAALDRGGPVVYLGTFSKTFCPRLRIGWMSAPSGARVKLLLVKQGADLHTSSLAQHQLARHVERYDPDARLETPRGTYLAAALHPTPEHAACETV